MAVTYQTQLVGYDLAKATSTITPQFFLYGYQDIVSSGAGYLSGSYPDGLVTDDGVPVSADILIRIRSKSLPLNGLLVAQVKSAPDGTWLVTNLNPDLKYDAIARLDGRNDVIGSNLTPKV